MTLLTDAELETLREQAQDGRVFHAEKWLRAVATVDSLKAQLADRNQAAHEALEKLGAANRECDNLETQLAAATALAKRLADDAMVALAGSKIPTPEEGYLKSPHCLGADIKRLRQERDAATAELAAIKKPVEGEKLAAGAFEKFSRIMDSQGFLPLSKWELQSGVYQRAWREAIAFVRASADAERERKQPEAAESKPVILHAKTVDGKPLGEEDVRLLQEYIDGQRNCVPTPIAAAIHSMRLYCGLGMRQFAELCGIVPSEFCKFEHGEFGWSAVSPETQERMLVELGKAAEIARTAHESAIAELQAKLEAAENKAKANRNELDAAVEHFSRRTAENDQLRQRAEASSPDDLRDKGWAVAVHNDYRQGGENFTFWLFTKGGHAIKGEGRSDAEALDMVREAIAALLGQAEAANDRLAAELAEAKTKLAELERDCEQMACYEQERHELAAALGDLAERAERARKILTSREGGKPTNWAMLDTTEARKLLGSDCAPAPHPSPSQGTQAGEPHCPDCGVTKTYCGWFINGGHCTWAEVAAIASKPN